MNSMLQIIKEREPKTIKEFALLYDDGHGNGFQFPCDWRGIVEEMSPEAQANYEYCKAHPEEFVRSDVLVTFKHTYIEPARGICSCGEEITLDCDYDGACQCPNCGRWYNSHGQSLLPPEMWEDDIDDGCPFERWESEQWENDLEDIYY